MSVFTYFFFKLQGLIHLARESVNQKLLDLALAHCLFQERECDLLGDDFTCLDVISNQLAVLAPFSLLFGPEQVASTQMLESIFLHQTSALSSLARARASKHKDD